MAGKHTPISCRSRNFILSVLVSSCLAAGPDTLVQAAMPSVNAVPASSTQAEGAKESALSALSGSKWPGIIDHLLQRPVKEEGHALIHMNYPSVGNKTVDADIRLWVESLANAFEGNLDLKSALAAETPANTELDAESFLERAGPFLQDDDLYSENGLQGSGDKTDFELWGDYSISRPSPAAISITYELWNYIGQPQGNLDVLTLNYNLQNGQRLALVDIFEDPDRALELMSVWSRKELENKLGNLRKPMLDLGTEPLIENFSSLTLIPEGLCINFQPFQVAPWDAGIQKVVMPLKELLPARPLLFLWDRQ